VSDELKGKVALVTGASRGLGEGAARALAAAGASVMLLARDGKLAGDVAQAIGRAQGRAEAVACDVSDYAAVQQVLAQTEARLGPVDILVNNAGVIEPVSEVATSDPAIWAESISINLVGAYYALRAVLPGMLARGGGTIVNVSSGAAYRPLEGWSAYCSGKAGLAMLTRAVALETAGKGIRIFGFSPGTIDTDMQVKIRASGMNMISRIPRADLSPVEHAVRGLMYLCSTDAEDLLGQDASMRDDAFRKRIGLA
jgi:NAD(P)-dependent dehydrogenase (short-subunit alcohol dehydrogenase family)